MTTSRSLRLALLAGLALVLPACATSSPTLPSISPAPGSPHLEGRFVWHDLLTDDLPAAEAFYSGLFGWEFRAGDEGAGENYRTVLFEGRAVAGVIALPDEGETGPQWISSLSVADVDVATGMTGDRGGTVYRDAVDVTPRGRMAVVSDPQGALFALVRSADGDPPVMEPRENGWLWIELWTRDVGAAAAFYRDLAGYQTADFDTALVPDGYTTFTLDGEPVAGVLEYDYEGVRPLWLPYVRVRDAEAAAEQAVALGGTLLIPPGPDVRGGSAAVIADPSGAAIVVQEWTPGQGGGR